MRETRSSGSAEGVMSNHDPYSDSRVLLTYVGDLRNLLAILHETGTVAISQSSHLRCPAELGQTPSGLWDPGFGRLCCLERRRMIGKLEPR